MENLIFKCLSKDINLIQFTDNTEYLGSSRIDGSPIYKTSDNLMFSDYVIDVLNTKNKKELILILRRKKLEKIIKTDKIVLSLQYEFLNFWYNNFDCFDLMKPMENNIPIYVHNQTRAGKMRKIYNKITIPGYKLKRTTI